MYDRNDITKKAVLCMEDSHHLQEKPKVPFSVQVLACALLRNSTVLAVMFSLSL